MPPKFSMPRTGFILLPFLPWLILCLGLAVTYIGHDIAQQHVKEILQGEFDSRFNEIIADIEGRLSAHKSVLQGAAGLFVAAQEVDRDGFRKYVSALNPENSHLGIQGMGYSLLLATDDRGRHPAKARGAEAARYAIWPEGARETYTAIIYLEPSGRRARRAFGYDMYTEPTRRAAMARARDENRVIVSGKVKLAQETDAQAGFLMYVPVYRHDALHETPVQRRACLQGWIFSPFRINDLMKGILGKHFGEDSGVLDLKIYDGGTPSAESLMYGTNATMERSAPAPRPVFRAARMFDVGGRDWTITMSSLPGFEARLKSDRAALILLAGGAVSLLLAAVVWLLINGRARALALATGMTRELRASESHLKALFEHMSSGVAVYGAAADGEDFYLTAFNRAAGQIGRARSAVSQGKSVREVFPDCAESGLLDALGRVWHSGVAEQFSAAFHVDGQLAGWRENHVYKLPDGTVVAICDDITERRRAELGLESLNRFYSVLSRVNEAIVRTAERQALFESVCRIAVEDGKFTMAWIGLLDGEKGEIFPAASWGHEAGYLDYLQSVGVLGYNGPTCVAIRNGEYRISQDIATDSSMTPWRQAALDRGYHASAAFPLSLEGEVVGAISLYASRLDAFGADALDMLKDLSADVSFALGALDQQERRRAAEERLRQLNEELERRVVERTWQLEAANMELESFSYSVSHDLRAPLRSIDGFSEILEKRYAERLDDSGRDYLGRVRRASKRMGELIDDLLLLSRVTRAELRKEAVDLSQMVRVMASEMQEAVPQRRVEWVIQDGVVAQADSRLIKVVLENLLGNAWKFTAHQSAPRIEFGMIERENEKAMFMRDNGAGFDMQYAGKLFGAFQRLHRADEFEGTGIGLATVQRIIHRHGGRVWAEGQSGAGATFYFTL